MITRIEFTSESTQMKSTRRKFCFVALRTNLKDIKPTKKNTFYDSTKYETIQLCPDEEICVGISNYVSHKDKACF